MPALIGRQPVVYGLLSGALHLQVQRRVHPQSAFVNLVGTVLLFQILPNLFHKIGSDVVVVALNVHHQGRVLRALGFLGGDLAVLEHGVDHQIAPAQRPLRIVDRRIRVGRLGQTRKHARLLPASGLLHVC